jgi:Recombination endonuclease VII
MATKVCNKCGECERCKANARQHKWRLKNAAKVKAYRKTDAAKESNRNAVAKHRAANRDVIVARRRQQRKENPAQYRDKNLRRLYGITNDQYVAMLVEQKGWCAICKTAHKDGSPLVVDHCHTTGKVRKLLCQHCNRALGLFRENTASLANAIQYLQHASVAA